VEELFTGDQLCGRLGQGGTGRGTCMQINYMYQ